MHDVIAARAARGAHWGLQPDDLQRLAALPSPEAVQDFVAAIPMNFEDGTCWSVQEVMRRNVAMCIEGAFVAAAALHLQGHPPLLVRQYANDGDDHVVVPFLRGGRWGAISKTNHLGLRWRDPVYHSLRELMASYLHEYFTGPVKTLRAYSDVFDLRRLPPAMWVTHEDSCMDVDQRLCAQHYYLLLDTPDQALRPRDALEQSSESLVEHPAPVPA